MSTKNSDPLLYFNHRIIEILRPILCDFGFSEEIALEIPPGGLGDFAFPCFCLAPILKKSPNEIAKSIYTKLPENNEINYECKGPYLNFKIIESKLVESVLNSIFTLKSAYGSHPKKGIMIILEHTSANPTDKLHVGRARNPIIGDTLARILRCAGFEVETQYYVDDMGKQTARKILELRHTDWDRSKFKTGYQWATSVTTPDSEDYNSVITAELDQIMAGLESGGIETLREAEQVCELMMDDVIIPSLKKINVNIDKYVNESQFMLDNSVNDVIDKLKASEFVGIEDGAFFIDLNQFDIRSGKDKFFFIRADGKSLYATRDIAYHHWKFKNCDIALNILGEDHKLEAEYVRVGLQLTGKDKYPENIFYAFVNLPEGRMSTRKGQVVYIEDLVDEAILRAVDEVNKRREDLSEVEIEEISKDVGIGAIRFNIIHVQAEKKIVFKWEDALNFEGDSAPFIQYAYARACSILRKAEVSKIEYIAGKYNTNIITNDFEHAHIKMLAKLPGIVKECADKRAAHILANYAHEIAASFNQFYRECPVLHAGNIELLQARLAIVEATRIVLSKTLELLGIVAPERM